MITKFNYWPNAIVPYSTFDPLYSGFSGISRATHVVLTDRDGYASQFLYYLTILSKKDTKWAYNACVDRTYVNWRKDNKRHIGSKQQIITRKEYDMPEHGEKLMVPFMGSQPIPIGRLGEADIYSLLYCKELAPRKRVMAYGQSEASYFQRDVCDAIELGYPFELLTISKGRVVHIQVQ